jgi:hypothetical protein
MKLDFAIIILLFIFILFVSADLLREPVKKDCSIAEISPDFTPEEKNLCRKLRMNPKL